MNQERRFLPTALGLGVNDYLVSRFPRLIDIGFTAGMEDQLDLIEEGTRQYPEVLEAFHSPFLSELSAAESEKKGRFSWGETDIASPECGRPLQIKSSGKTGEFLACSGYPECRFTSDFEDTEEGQIRLSGSPERPEKCPECQSAMALKQGPTGPFLGCTRYPECKGTRPFSTGVRCPMEGCEGELIVRRTRRGKTFYGCSSYPGCRFALWDEPVRHTCPSCGFPVMTRPRSGKGLTLVCGDKSCGHREKGDASG